MTARRVVLVERRRRPRGSCRVLGVIRGEQPPLRRSRFGKRKTMTAPSTTRRPRRVYAQSWPSTNDVLAAAMICVACLDTAGDASAPPKDFVSWLWTLSVTCLCDPAIAAVAAGAVPGGEQRTEDRLHDGAAEVVLQVAVPEAMRARCNRHRAVEGLGRGRPREARRRCRRRRRRGRPSSRESGLLPEEQHRQETEQQNT